tara:strand:- start:837 stop:1277 length:441 start_codon:yes stop_codon:yes gene_type:complete
MGLKQDRARDIIDEVRDVAGLAGLFFEAAETEKKLPSVRRLSVKSCWPDYAPDPNLSFGYNETETRLPKATPREISRYDMALDVGMLLEVSDRKLLWASVHSAARRQRGVAWKKIGRLMNMHPETVKRRFDRAVLELWYKCNKSLR